MENILEVLPIIGKGYAGVFIVMGIIMFGVFVLNRWKRV